MIRIRRSAERGFADHGWLQSHHTFSFADYYDPAQMGFGVLRVINEDRVAAGRGFDTHPHKNMEIITYVISGAVAHKDSMGNTMTIGAGTCQAMSAGRGVQHSEFNPSSSEQLHLLQIWIIPEKKDLSPSYQQWPPVGMVKASQGLSLVASADGRDGSMIIHQRVDLFIGRQASGTTIAAPTATKRDLWLQMISGKLTLNEHQVLPGDGVAISGEQSVSLTAGAQAHYLLFVLAS